MKSSTQTLIASLRVLSRDIHCEDGVAAAAISEAADRLEELDGRAAWHYELLTAAEERMIALRFTDAEREVIAECLSNYRDSAVLADERFWHRDAQERREKADVLSRLLERLR